MDYIFRILPNMFSGLGVSAQIFIFTIVLSLPLGMLLAMVRISKVGLFRQAAGAYIYLMRGTPLMLQIMFIYYGLPLIFDLQISDFPAAILAFVANYAAYFAEIYRSGIQSIPVGQREAAKVLGYSRVQTFWKIIFPQMVKRVLPPVTNEVITLVKDTSLAFVLAYAEMFTIAKQIAAAQTTIVPLFVAGLFYYIFNLIVAVGMEYLEKHLSYYQ